jgi:lipopolysaccharide transport system permease protein
VSTAAEVVDELKADPEFERDLSEKQPPVAMPVRVIERKPGWRIIDLHELWRYRELLYFLTLRDIKVRYKQTVLGAAWAILQPLATMLVFSLFFGKLAGNPSSHIPYPLYVLAGMVPWMFFSNAIALAGQSVVGNQNLVTKIYFPRLMIPMGAVGAGLVDLAISFAVLFVMMLWYRVVPSWSFLLAPLVTMGLIIAAVGVGALLAALTVAYRDFRHAVPFLVQFWMFATPSIYMQAGVSANPVVNRLLPFNPAYGLIAALRQTLLGGPIDGYSLAVSATVSAIALLGGCLYFRRVESDFADII